MEHQDVLYEISIHEGPLQSVAQKELKKARHSVQSLIGIYTIALNCETALYSAAAIQFMKNYIAAEKQQAENIKSDIVNIRISPKERRLLEEKANNQQMSISQYIRYVLFDNKEKKHDGR